MSEYDVFSVRGLYTSLGDGWTYLNAHSCPQIPERVSSAVARSFRLSTSVSRPDDHDGLSAGSHARRPMAGTPEGASFVRQARVAVADLIGVRPECVVLGPSLPVLYVYLARSLGRMVNHSSSVVLSSLDAPELTAPFASGAGEVRWAQPDLGTGELPRFQFRDLIDGSTRLVSFSAAHGLLGAVTDVAGIVDEVRSRSRAWTLVDVSSLAPYRQIDFDALGADIVGVDLAELGGPHISALVFRDSLMFKRLTPVAPGSNAERGTSAVLESPISSGLAGGVTALVDHLASLTESTGSRRDQLSDSMNALSAYMTSLAEDLYLFLGSLPSVHILGVTGEAAAGATRDRLPRLSFAVSGVPAETVQRRLVSNGLITSLTPHTPLLQDMGVGEIGGAVTVGLGPFSTSHDLDHLVRVVASLA